MVPPRGRRLRAPSDRAATAVRNDHQGECVPLHTLAHMLSPHVCCAESTLGGAHMHTWEEWDKSLVWLYLPSSVLPPVEADSMQELPSHSADMLARSATWRTKSAQPRHWSRAWKRNSWMRRLSGLTSSPSTVARGAASWMESLAATRVSRSASQDAGAEPTILATSGPTSPTSFGQLNLDGAFLRTSAVICDWDSEKSPKSFEAWATALRRHCGERRKSALLTAESASSSSQWTTPTKGDGDGGQTQPSAARRMGGGDRSLRVDAAQWPTPTRSMTEQWATPTSHERTHSPRLVDHGEQLANQADRWATPTSRDWKDATEPSEAVPTNSLLGRQAPRAMHGPAFPNATGPRRLNPLFVAWMMGAYWRALIGYESSATGSFQSRQQQRLENSGE